MYVFYFSIFLKDYLNYTDVMGVILEYKVFLIVRFGQEFLEKFIENGFLYLVNSYCIYINISLGLGDRE